MTAMTLLEGCEARGVRLSLEPDGKLAVDGPSGTLDSVLLENLRQHKAEILQALSLAPGGQIDDYLEMDEVERCSRCGGLTMWQDAFGSWRCGRCSPPMQALRWLEKTEQLRRRSGLESPPAARERLAELKRLCRGSPEQPADDAAPVAVSKPRTKRTQIQFQLLSK